MKKLGLLLIVLALVSCAPQPTAESVPVTVLVEVTVLVTQPPLPTDTPIPTDISTPTHTPQPTDTAVPTDTTTPTLTPSPSPTPCPTPVPRPNISASLLQAMRTTRIRMEEFGGLLDEAAQTGVLRCQPTVELYDATVGAPAFDVTGSSDTVQWAYGRYRDAIGIYSDQSRGLAEQCRNWLAGDAKDLIQPVGWTRARKSVNDALALLIPAIDQLE